VQETILDQAGRELKEAGRNYFMIFTSNYFCTPERLVDPFRGHLALYSAGNRVKGAGARS